MYLTKTAQITDERKQLLHQNGDKSFAKKVTGVSDDIVSQVRTLTVIYDGDNRRQLLITDSVHLLSILAREIATGRCADEESVGVF